jgi:hypothetical protein
MRAVQIISTCSRIFSPISPTFHQGPAPVPRFLRPLLRVPFCPLVFVAAAKLMDGQVRAGRKSSRRRRLIFGVKICLENVVDFEEENRSMETLGERSGRRC